MKDSSGVWSGPLGAGWATYPEQPRYLGESIRALTFARRADARLWCALKHANYRTYPDGHLCRKWRFKPIRVRETIQPI